MKALESGLGFLYAKILLQLFANNGKLMPWNLSG
jgi:hypothetical protein